MVQKKEKWRGNFTIPMTPFTEDNCIDEGVLRKEIQFCIEKGVNGLVVPAVVSEFELLSEKERKLMIRIPVEESAGKVPVVAGCSAVNIPLAVDYAVYAEKVGANAVIAMPPYVSFWLKPDFQMIYSYYKAISDAVSIPVWIQNDDITTLSLDQVIKLCDEIENVKWVKEEVKPSTHMISELIKINHPAVEGIMGGQGGRYLISEWVRGSSGCIIACEFCDAIQKIWDLLDDGKMEQAEKLFEQYLPAFVLEELMGVAFCKEIMKRRGIFKNNKIRIQQNPFDKDDMREIDRVWERLGPI
jgi:dihydrodipicolinate synthase/N-acetylneuraminate lyase